jgi:hypothetical protein
MRNRAKCLIVTAALAAFATQVYAQAPAGWKTVKDSSGRCKASVPSDWTVGDGVLAGSALGPNYRSTVVLAGVREDPQKPMSAETLHNFAAATVFENTPKRTFFAGTPTKPSGKVPSMLKYTVQLGGRPACTVEVTVPNGQDEALAKQIVATVAPAK